MLTLTCSQSSTPLTLPEPRLCAYSNDGLLPDRATYMIVRYSCLLNATETILREYTRVQWCTTYTPLLARLQIHN